MEHQGMPPAHRDASVTVDIVVALRGPAFNGVFTYSVPAHLIDRVLTGAMALVPFGPRIVVGYIVAWNEGDGSTTAPHQPLKPIIEILGAPLVNQEIIDLSRWVSENYLSGLGPALHATLPPTVRSRIRTNIKLTDPTATGTTLAQQAVIEQLTRHTGPVSLAALKRGADTASITRAISQLRERGVVRQIAELAPSTRPPRPVSVVRLVATEDQIDGFLDTIGRRATTQADLLFSLLNHPEGAMPVGELIGSGGSRTDALARLEKAGMVVRSTDGEDLEPSCKPPVLTRDQAGAIRSIAGALRSNRYRPFLLFGVTASGKTEVYLRAAAECLAHGRGVLYLAPEIALTSQVISQLRRRFGRSVAALHSHLGDAERFEQWQRIRRGECPIVIGARSAVFAPMPNPGLVVLDEEHEPSYKQETQPRYHAREVALERARSAGAVVLLGSATPSLETYNAAEAGELARLELPERVTSQPLPEVEVVDLRIQTKRSSEETLSAALRERVAEALEKGDQAILFLNRRAYAIFLLCRQCGHVPECPNCAVSLAVHQAAGRLRCHHCEYERLLPGKCPACDSARLKAYGIGTQRVAEEAERAFPNARVARLDRDALSAKNAHTDVLRAFRTGETDVLVGTQMVAKGLDFPRVGVVGVINADTAMHLPDFRASERTFQLITQVAGRAGRGERPGSVTVQTFNPEHAAIQFAREHDYVGFYTHEIEHRRHAGYPPFSRLMNIVVSGENSIEVNEASKTLATRLREVSTRFDVAAEVRGPAPCPIAKIRKLHRMHVLLKVMPTADIAAIGREALKGLEAGKCQITTDVDPQSMM